MERIRILLADPHTLVRAALRDLLGKEPDIEIVDAVSRGEEALHLTERLAPDVLLLEPLIIDPPGPKVAERVEAADVPTRVLALSRCKKQWMARRMLEKGVWGYFSKEDDPQALLEALRRVAAGEDGLLSSVISRKLFSRSKAEIDQAQRDLTKREWEVMRLVAEGLSNHEIADRLFIEASTARNHVSHVLGKLNVSSRVKLAVWAYRHDMVRLPPPPMKFECVVTTHRL